MTIALTRTSKILICNCLLQMSIFSAFCQTNIEDTIVLRKVFNEVSSQRQIAYVDSVNMNGYVPDVLMEAIQKGKITDTRKTRKPNSLTLTKAEQNYLLEQITQQTVWSDNLLADSRLIESDSMWVYLRQENTKRIAAMNKAAMENDTLALKKARLNYSYVFTFTKPVYIRDNTICLISFAAVCGTECGRNEISFYKKENNEWGKWIVISAGDF